MKIQKYNVMLTLLLITLSSEGNYASKGALVKFTRFGSFKMKSIKQVLIDNNKICDIC